jgi:hypothetical protein
VLPLTCLPASSPRKRGEERWPRPAALKFAALVIGEIRNEGVSSPRFFAGRRARQGDEGQRRERSNITATGDGAEKWMPVFGKKAHESKS